MLISCCGDKSMGMLKLKAIKLEEKKTIYSRNSNKAEP